MKNLSKIFFALVTAGALSACDQSIQADTQAQSDADIARVAAEAADFVTEAK